MKRKDIVILLGSLVCVGVIFFCGYKIGYKEYKNFQGEKLYDTLQDLEPEQKVNNEKHLSETEKLKAINSDYEAWINVPGTNISYPIARGNDNDYYLTHSFDKTDNFCGSIFMDYRNPKDLGEANTNSIIYGHNMLNDTMFAEMQDYKNKDFYEEHKTFTITNTSNEKIPYDIVAVRLYVNGDYKPEFKWNNQEEFKQYVQDMNGKSIYKINCEITNEPIVTLYTCDYTKKGARLIVVGQRHN